MKRKKLPKLVDFDQFEEKPPPKEKTMLVTYKNQIKPTEIIIDEDDLEMDESLENVLNQLEEQSIQKEKEKNKLIPKYSQENIERIIYPNNLPVRDYQLEISKSSIFQNTIVCLPTGEYLFFKFLEDLEKVKNSIF
jgi:regulatory protein YycH of two-component signal transduction system YycFG